MKYGMMLKVLTDISGKEKLNEMFYNYIIFFKNKTIPGVG